VKCRALELPPEIGRAFVRDMRLYFATENKIKRDEIAARQRHALAGHLPGRRVRP